MFRTQWSLLFAASLVASSVSLSARAFELSVVGVANSSTPSLTVNGAASTGYSSKPALGGGVLLGFSLSSWTELEIGGLYLGRDYTYPAPSSGQQEDSFYSYEIPVVWRFIPFKYVSIGGGGYYSIPTGQDTYTLTPSGGTGTSSNSSAANSFKGEAGILASLALKIPFGVASSLLLDARYCYGLTNATKITGEDLKFRDVEALFGLSFGF